MARTGLVSPLSSSATATTELYTLSLHDALPISGARLGDGVERRPIAVRPFLAETGDVSVDQPRIERLRSEEHTSELQSHVNLVCRLLLEKKKTSLCRCSGRLLGTPTTAFSLTPA